MLDVTDPILERYCAGDSTPAELVVVERWLAEDPARAGYLALIQAAWREVGLAAVPEERPDVRAAKLRVQNRIRANAQPPLRLGADATAEDRARSPWRRLLGGGSLWAAAAALLLVVGGGVLATRAGDRARQEHGTRLTLAQEVVTRRGQRVSFDLPDGSRVIVAPESRLGIPMGYQKDGGPRELLLEGEAYFEVKHDSLRPFRIRAGNGIVEDIGTSFVVTAYPETRGVQVAVAEGAVALRTARTVVSRPGAVLTLGRGQLGWIDSSGTGTLTREVDVTPYTSWTTGKLVFDGTPMRDVVPRLSRWYDLTIQMADSSIADRRFTQSVFQDDTPRQVLEALAFSLGLRVDMVGRHVVLSAAQ